MTKFNIFKVLEKDDKELIHSSFIKYLLVNWGEYFYKNLFHINHSDFKTPELEKSYSRKRFDIFIESKNGNEIVLIENKFKSFPHIEQLNTYDRILKKHFINEIKFLKFLICFDTELIYFPVKDWKILSYIDLLNSLNLFLESNKNIPSEERIFIQHYVDFLNEYYFEYENRIKNVNSAFNDLTDKKNKFWLRLIYSILRNKLEMEFKKMNISVTFDVASGSTSVPFIDILPYNWKKDGIQKLIQLQGEELKFYIHSDDKKYVDELISKVEKSNLINKKNGKLKILTKREARTYYIYKEKITDIFTNSAKIDDIKNYIIEFYSRMDKIMTD